MPNDLESYWINHPLAYVQLRRNAFLLLYGKYATNYLSDILCIVCRKMGWLVSAV